MNADEQAAMDAVNSAMRAVLNIGGNPLRANHSEVIAAVHVLQSCVAQHVLHRIDPANWSDWYGRAAATEDTATSKRPRTFGPDPRRVTPNG